MIWHCTVQCQYNVRKASMILSSESFNSTGNKRWESVHICPKCGFVLNLCDIDLRTVTTGIVECPRCEWVGPVVIEIVEMDALVE